MDTETHDMSLSPEIDRIIEDVLRGTADCRETALLEEWVAASPDNRTMFEQKRALHEAMSPAFSPLEIDTEKALSRVHKRMGVKPAWHLFALRFAAAMVLPLCVALAYLLLRAPAQNADVAMLSLTAPFGSVLETRLPDGSQVWLNANSSLEYPAVFAGKERRVSLSGEGYFEVSADTEHPFIVRAGDIDVKATGTAFNVNAYSGCPYGVTLLEGYVDVTAGSNRHFEMSPGEHLRISGTSSELTQMTDNQKRYSWKDGILMFDNDRLNDVLTRLSQIYPVDFVIQTPELAAARYHATFNGESLQDILNLLEIGVPLRCVTEHKADSAQRMVVHIYPAVQQ